jgi:hypothetical protein
LKPTLKPTLKPIAKPTAAYAILLHIFFLFTRVLIRVYCVVLKQEQASAKPAQQASGAFQEQECQ